MKIKLFLAYLFLIIGVIVFIFSVKLPCISVFCSPEDSEFIIYPTGLISIVLLIIAYIFYLWEQYDRIQNQREENREE